MQFVTEAQPSLLQQALLQPVKHALTQLWLMLTAAWHLGHDIDARLTVYCLAPSNRVLCTLLLTTFIIVSLSHMLGKGRGTSSK